MVLYLIIGFNVDHSPKPTIPIQQKRAQHLNWPSLFNSYLNILISTLQTQA